MQLTSPTIIQRSSEGKPWQGDSLWYKSQCGFYSTQRQYTRLVWKSHPRKTEKTERGHSKQSVSV
jgi:hypothetical protein